MAVIWYSVAPTPQFVEVINKLSEKLDVQVFHLEAGDRGRGWGRLEIGYDYTLAPRGAVAIFKRIFSLVRPGTVTTGIFLGYSSPFAIVGLVALRLTRRKVFFLADSSIIIERGRPFPSRLAKLALLRMILSRETRIWTVSGANAEYWRYYGYYNLHPVPFSSPMPAASLDASTKTPTFKGQTILFVGRIVPEKGLADLVSAFQLLTRDGVNLRLVVAGPQGKGGASWQSPRGVVWLGPLTRDDLSTWFAEADVLAVPSRVEPYGLVVREALQFGLPVVATDQVPAALDLCNRGWNIVQVGDTSGLASAIRLALEHERWAPRVEEDLEAAIAKDLGRPNLRREAGRSA